MNSWPVLDLPPLADTFDIPRLSLFDNASQSIKPVKAKDFYTMYVCGITPYDATHLGHAATYLTFDLINRYLRLSGARVRFVQNITDVDDPLLERAIRDGQDWRELAASQIELFRGDMVNLHILPPDEYIGVVESMQTITDSIASLIASGNTYRLENDIYFSVKADSSFGTRSHLSESEMLRVFSERGGDPDRVGKKDKLDALLWRGERAGEPSWESPFGPGRPGWHIECSAIALRYLHNSIGSPVPSDCTIDIQGGGSDLIFPHHEMSASQAKIITGQEFASHYVHSGMIGLDGEKMSKSLGNLVFVSKLITQGIAPAAIRWALFSSHYSTDRMWNDSLLAESTHWIDRLRTALSRVDVAPTQVIISEILTCLSNNLDTATALLLIQQWVVETERGATGGEAGELSRALDTILGITL